VPGLSQEFRSGEECNKGVAALGNPFPSAGFPIHNGENTQDLCPVFFENADGFHRASPTGESILDDDGRCTRGQPPLDPAAGPVVLGLLADREALDRRSLDPASMCNGIGHRVGSEREAPHPAGRGKMLTKGLQSHDTDEKLALGRHRGEPGIDIPGRTCSAREGKVTDGEGTFDEQRAELLTMVHRNQVPRWGRPVKRRVSVRTARATLVLGILLFPVACSDAPLDPADFLFGQVGEIQVEVRSPLGLPAGLPGVTQGALYETLRWQSNGGWTLAERVTYDGVVGSETVRRSRLNPGQLTQEYASLIQQLTEPSPLQLFGLVPEDLAPNCGAGAYSQLATQVTISIHDELRGAVARWTRCSRGLLLAPNPANGITPGVAGPGVQAARVIAAAQLVRSFTLGNASASTYAGTVPFATLDQGENSPGMPEGARVFRSTQSGPPSAFVEFWKDHAGPDTPLPDVNWPQEMVVLAAVGARAEAGDIVQIRRVVNVGTALRIEFVEQIPGDFCSPAARSIHPFHLVVLPTSPLPAEFAAPQVERVPCGL